MEGIKNTVKAAVKHWAEDFPFIVCFDNKPEIVAPVEDEFQMWLKPEYEPSVGTHGYRVGDFIRIEDEGYRTVTAVSEHHVHVFNDDPTIEPWQRRTCLMLSR